MPVKIISINVNSLVERRRKILMDNFIARNPAHVYCIQETKLGPTHKHFCFSSFSTFGASNRFGCGGVAIMIHAGLRVRNIQKLTGIIDGIFAEIFIGNEWVQVGSIYVHPKCTDIGPLDKVLNSRMQSFVGGDFNARYHSFGDVADNVIGNIFVRYAANTGCILLSPPVPTCYRSEHGSFIDKFMIGPSPSFTFSALAVIPTFSDHAAIAFSINCPSADLPTKMSNGFLLKQYGLVNITRMNDFLEERLNALQMPTDRNLECGELEFLAERIELALTQTAAKFVPTKFVRCNAVPLSKATLALRRKFHAMQKKAVPKYARRVDSSDHYCHT